MQLHMYTVVGRGSYTVMRLISPELQSERLTSDVLGRMSTIQLVLEKCPFFATKSDKPPIILATLKIDSV